MQHNWHLQGQKLPSPAAQRSGSARQRRWRGRRGSAANFNQPWSVWRTFKDCSTLAKVHLILLTASVAGYTGYGSCDNFIFIFRLPLIKSSFHVTRPSNNRIWQALLQKLGFLPGHQCQPASHKCFMRCWYGNHRISTMTPCESRITMAVFQACETLAAVQQSWSADQFTRPPK